MLPIPFDHSLYLKNCSTPAILRETSCRHIPKCNERFARQYRSVFPRKCHLSGPNTHALTENAVKITVASPKPLSRSLSVARAHTQAFTFIARTETQCHLSTQHRASGTEPKRRRQTHAHVKGEEWMETPLRSSMLSLESCYYHQDRGGWREA